MGLGVFLRCSTSRVHFQPSAEQERLWLLAGMRVDLERLEKDWDEAAEPRNSSGWAWAGELPFLSQGLSHGELLKAQGTAQSLGRGRMCEEGHGSGDTAVGTWQ